MAESAKVLRHKVISLNNLADARKKKAAQSGAINNNPITFYTTMISLIFATNNQHKVDEIQSLTGSGFSVKSLKQADIEIDIPEPFDTLEANAETKARTIFDLTQTNCFSEDTGLEVNALNGEPGVKSARYAGDSKSFDDNIDKLLLNLNDINDRSARFRTVINLIYNGKEYFFEGICEGTILKEKSGTGGFGYDPVFMPKGAEKSFAQMTMDEKNKYSHRAKATAKLISFLSTAGK